MDRIDQKSIKIIKVLNDTKAPSNYRLVKWDLPKDPNGIIVSIEFTTTHLATKNPVRDWLFSFKCCQFTSR